jgi:hypothetical protein
MDRERPTQALFWLELGSSNAGQSLPASRSRGRPSLHELEEAFKESKMKSLRVILSVALMSLATVAFAQNHSDMQKPVAQSDAQKSFDKLKTLAGAWEGRVITTPPHPEVDGSITQIAFRVTSMGNVLMHDLKSSVRPDNPITMLYLDADRLLLTHYCDAGNRPRMVGKMSPDGKTVEFEFLDVAGGTEYGHMHHAVFTMIDENHHIEDWTYMHGDKPVHAHFELQRTK